MLWQVEAIKHRVPDVRTLMDIKEILFDKKWFQKNIRLRDQEIYYMYRGVSKPKDEPTIRKSGLRYDITVIPPLMMGDEYVKTAGHYHPIAIGELTYAEVYQILDGEAIFLIQKVDNFDKHNLIDVAFAKAKAGDVFVVPPNFGHITINTSKKPLVMANWSADGFNSLYEPIERMCGAAYFFTKDGWVRNLRYGLVPPLREIKCRKMDDMYEYVSELKRLGFLKNPTLRPPPQEPKPKSLEPKETAKKEILEEEKEKKKEKEATEEIIQEKAEESAVEETTEEETVPEECATEERIQEEPAIEEVQPEIAQTEPSPEEIIPQEGDEPSQEPSLDEPGQQNGKYSPIGF
jgi:glucose-6-phosphate isomerase